MFSIQGPKKTRQTTTASALGTKASVASWIWVTACTVLIATPTMRLTISSGAETLSAVQRASMPRPITHSCVIASPTSFSGLQHCASGEAAHQRAGDQIPAVHQHEQQDLEGQGD